MSRGFFAVLEGPEGSGKSTLIRTLGDRARAAGRDAVVVREPGSTPTAEAVRAILLHRDFGFGGETELFLFLAARADHVRKVLEPALDAGKLVLSDRFQLSTFAYQVAGRGLDRAMVAAANRLATGGLEPDLTLIMDISPEEGRKRQMAAGKTLDRLDSEPEGFHRRVYEEYLATTGKNVRHLDGRLGPEALLEAAWAALKASGAVP